MIDHTRPRHRLAACCLALMILATAGAAAGASRSSQASTADTPIDLNQASAEQLTRLPGIGEALAKRIVDFREQHGPFKRVEDLMKVKGIGEKSFEKLRPYIKVGKKR
jgi:competence protein ComEA